MQSRWSDRDATEFVERLAPTWGEEMALRVYTSRLIGRDPDLVMHGGGNTSLKGDVTTLVGDTVEALFVKGSGWDLDAIEPPGLPAVDLSHLRRLHAFLPHKFIDHTHADVALVVTNQPLAENEALAREAFGPTWTVVPYVMPGFALAKLAAECFERDAKVEGLVLLNHGLFTFADDARTAYERMIAGVDRAERFVSKQRKAAARTTVAVGADLAGAARTAARLAPLLRAALAEPTADGDRPWRRW